MLLVFQAMDAAGKDGTIKHVMSRVNPQGCSVHSFKQPSDEELSHDFLWRYATRVPERGRIGIFNRWYYEEVLVVRVHQELLKAQKMLVPYGLTTLQQGMGGLAERLHPSDLPSVLGMEDVGGLRAQSGCSHWSWSALQ